MIASIICAYCGLAAVFPQLPEDNLQQCGLHRVHGLSVECQQLQPTATPGNSGVQVTSSSTHLIQLLVHLLFLYNSNYLHFIKGTSGQ